MRAHAARRLRLSWRVLFHPTIEEHGSSVGTRGASLYLTAFAPAAVQRPVVLLRGAEPTASATHSALDSLRELRRDGNLGVVVRASIVSSIEPLPAGRALFHGSIEQLQSDIIATYAAGAAQIVFDLSHDSPGHSLDELLSRISRVIALVPVESRVSESVAAAA